MLASLHRERRGGLCAREKYARTAALGRDQQVALILGTVLEMDSYTVAAAGVVAGCGTRRIASRKTALCASSSGARRKSRSTARPMGADLL